MLLGRSVHDLLWPIAIVGGLGSIACVPVTRVTCDAVRCDPEECRERGQSALENGQPDLAVCNFRHAVALNGSDIDARLGYGTSLAIMGETGPARQQFRWVMERSMDDGSRAVARAWLTAIETPFPFAVYYREDDGCSPDTQAGEKASGSLRRTLSRFGTFRAVTTDAGSRVFQGGEGKVCAQAEKLGAQVALIVRVRCARMSAIRNPALLGGIIQIQNITKYTSTVALSVDVYQARKRERRMSLAQEGTASNISERAAIWTAVDIGVSGVVLRLAKELLYGSS